MIIKSKKFNSQTQENLNKHVTIFRKIQKQLLCEVGTHGD
jgi:hypothetical protein